MGPSTTISVLSHQGTPGKEPLLAQKRFLSSDVPQYLQVQECLISPGIMAKWFGSQDLRSGGLWYKW